MYVKEGELDGWRDTEREVKGPQARKLSRKREINLA